MKLYPPFQFKQFQVQHQQSPMKIGTDALVLGAVAAHISPQRILDAGTGSGVISLMLAQRFPQAAIVAVEKHHASASEAALNFLESPFAHRLELREGDILDITLEGSFDLVVCNPPFYRQEGAALADVNRLQARNSDYMPIEQLLPRFFSWLKEEGVAWLIWPWEDREFIEEQAFKAGFSVAAAITVKDRPESQPSRMVYGFARQDVFRGESVLVLKQEDGSRSPEWQHLSNAFFTK